MFWQDFFQSGHDVIGTNGGYENEILSQLTTTRILFLHGPILLQSSSNRNLSVSFSPLHIFRLPSLPTINHIFPFVSRSVVVTPVFLAKLGIKVNSLGSVLGPKVGNDSKNGVLGISDVPSEPSTGGSGCGDSTGKEISMESRSGVWEVRAPNILNIPKTFLNVQVAKSIRNLRCENFRFAKLVTSLSLPLSFLNSIWTFQVNC